MIEELVHKVVQSPNFNERLLPLNMVVIHYTEMKPVETALARLCDAEAGVSAHYLISEEGEVMNLVAEDKRAWHAGVSYWRGVRDVNSASIGIELDHPGHKDGDYRGFSEAQIGALIPLLRRMMKEHNIPLANVVGHSDVAPQRKIDPGELFPWERLAAEGLCLPRPEGLEHGDFYDSDDAFLLALENFGYDIADGVKAVEAFQRRWRPALISGAVDAECGAILYQLLLSQVR